MRYSIAIAAIIPLVAAHGKIAVMVSTIPSIIITSYHFICPQLSHLFPSADLFLSDLPANKFTTDW
jgi:hypothetical protein